MRRYVLDVETTGFQNADIIQLAYFEVNDRGAVLQTFNRHYYTKKKIPMQVVKLVGYNNYKLKELAGTKTFREALNKREVPALNQDDIIQVIGYGVEFDARMIRTYRPNIKIDTLCLLKLARSVYAQEKIDGVIDNFKLKSVYEISKSTLGLTDEVIKDMKRKISNTNDWKPHDALTDVFMTYVVMLDMVKRGLV